MVDKIDFNKIDENISRKRNIGTVSGLIQQQIGNTSKKIKLCELNRAHDKVEVIEHNDDEKGLNNALYSDSTNSEATPGPNFMCTDIMYKVNTAK